MSDAGPKELGTPTNGNETATLGPPAESLAGDLWLLLVAPARLFIHLPRVNRVGWALMLLLLLQMLVGWSMLSTGVFHYEVAAATEREIPKFERQHEGDEDQNAVVLGIEAIEKGATFQKLMLRLQVLVLEPVRTLGVVCFFSGVLFSWVAVTGGKPNYSILAAVPTFAAFADLPRQAARVYLMSQLHVSRVETSPAAWVTHLGPDGVGLPLYLLLRRLDPFEWWYWVLFWLGARYAGQLTVRGATTITLVLALSAALVQSLVELPTLANITVQWQMGEPQ